MAAPTEVTLRNLSGTWTLSSSLSDDPSPALELQDVSWLVRNVIANAPVTISITQTVDPTTGVTKIASTQSTLGRTVSDVRYLEWEVEDQQNHPLFGSLSMRSRWAKASDLGEGFLIGNADGEAELIEVLAHGTMAGWTSHQVWAFEEIDGHRYHTRRALVTKGDQQVQVRMVYDWQTEE
ncbi:hypothetical protein ETB97_008324 [Aspergillus alliaceus]|uniref:Uncharacterized protein n=1 Tax=Petromyces alliaceus TaxID=209559 RepID=A0A411KZV0_PETAA|nr:hypothetical protein BDV23DRAFT_188098 [Aspergillus alliaceus]KAF5855842.1 hypothetical protein ETB97_008324 [Aspergillus burnettii]QBE85648.1 hypothetical protein [Aspergillus burnettii]